jgi:hypothetical protein
MPLAVIMADELLAIARRAEAAAGGSMKNANISFLVAAVAATT